MVGSIVSNLVYKMKSFALKLSC